MVEYRHCLEQYLGVYHLPSLDAKEEFEDINEDGEILIKGIPWLGAESTPKSKQSSISYFENQHISYVYSPKERYLKRVACVYVYILYCLCLHCIESFSMFLACRWYYRYVALLLLCVPRLFVMGFLGVIGCQYLAQTSSLSDIVLNAVALAFVLEVDELVANVLLTEKLRGDWRRGYRNLYSISLSTY